MAAGATFISSSISCAFPPSKSKLFVKQTHIASTANNNLRNGHLLKLRAYPRGHWSFREGLRLHSQTSLKPIVGVPYWSECNGPKRRATESKASMSSMPTNSRWQWYRRDALERFWNKRVIPRLTQLTPLETSKWIAMAAIATWAAKLTLGALLNPYVWMYGSWFFIVWPRKAWHAHELNCKKMALRSNFRKYTCLLPHFASCPMRSTFPAGLHSHATSFGFKDVPEEEKSRMVGDVFSSVASKYDIMNDIMSVGLHRLWKDRLVSKLSPFPGMQHLDVAGGTGDVAFRVLEAIHTLERQKISGAAVDEDAENETQVFICDINPAMLEVGRRHAIAKGLGEARSLIWMEGDAEALKFEDASMDGYTIAFGIRNVTHIEKALSEAYRVLRRGGRFLCLELSHVNIPGFRELYDFYSFSVIPSIGEIVAGDRASYQYLVESIRKFPSQEKFAALIREVGFEKVEYENLAGGVVAIHSGFKL